MRYEVMVNLKTTLFKRSALSSFISILMIGLALFADNVYANLLPSSATPELIQSMCKVDAQRQGELVKLNKEILAANDLASARQLALSPTEDALKAVGNARLLLPLSSDLESAEARLESFKAHIQAATSKEEVVDELNGVMLAGLDNDSAARVKIGSGGCDYSSGELIAIVLGLILGIIPGIILMVVLC